MCIDFAYYDIRNVLKMEFLNIIIFVCKDTKNICNWQKYSDILCLLRNLMIDLH